MVAAKQTATVTMRLICLRVGVHRPKSWPRLPTRRIWRNVNCPSKRWPCLPTTSMTWTMYLISLWQSTSLRLKARLQNERVYSTTSLPSLVLRNRKVSLCATGTLVGGRGDPINLRSSAPLPEQSAAEIFGCLEHEHQYHYCTKLAVSNGQHSERLPSTYM